jgi:radical SAM protein with 4Fe4S-binding SPASM domain
MNIVENTKKIYNNNVEQKLIGILGSKYKNYREAWSKADSNNIPNFPIHLDMEFFDICNQKCTFCPRNETIHTNLPYKINTNIKIEDQLIEKIINECKLKNLMSINFGAFAEPLVYKNIFKIVKKFSSIGVVDSRLITNGLLLDKFNDQVFDSGLINLYLSIDAFSEETYLIQRGHGYKKVIHNILNFLEKKKINKSSLPIVRVSFVETDHNKHELTDFINFWKDKVDHIDLQKKIDYSKDIQKKHFNKKSWNCIDPFRRVSIISDGSILPCCSFWGRSLVIGNIRDMTIQSAWNSLEMKKIRENLILDKSPICNTCQSKN